MERVTGTKRAPGPKLTADVIGRSEPDSVFTPGMSACEGAADGAAVGLERPGDGVAAGVPVRVWAGRGWGLPVRLGRGLAVPAGCGLAVRVGCGLAVRVGCGLAVADGRGLAVLVGSGRAVGVGFRVAVRVGSGPAVRVGSGLAVWVGSGAVVRVGSGLAVRVGCGLDVRVGSGRADGGGADPLGSAGAGVAPGRPGMLALLAAGAAAWCASLWPAAP